MIGRMFNERLEAMNAKSLQLNPESIPSNSIKLNPNYAFGDKAMHSATRTTYANNPRYEDLQKVLPIRITRKPIVNGKEMSTPIDIPFELDMSEYFVQDPLHPKAYKYALRSFTARMREGNLFNNFISYSKNTDNEWFFYNPWISFQHTPEEHVVKRLRRESTVLFYELKK